MGSLTINDKFKKTLRAKEVSVDHYLECIVTIVEMKQITLTYSIHAYMHIIHGKKVLYYDIVQFQCHQICFCGYFSTFIKGNYMTMCLHAICTYVNKCTDTFLYIAINSHYRSILSALQHNMSFMLKYKSLTLTSPCHLILQ